MTNDNTIDDNDDDLESPGYEYLRSYQNMINLHTKLLVLNYEKEFCLAYKCPAIHKLYFSMPSNNQNEQRFLFTCLCAWLIKDKCHMNLEIEPEEYEDLDVILGVVSEALRLITDDHSGRNIPNQSRLRRACGPEVVWVLNILADRALEMLLDNDHSGDSASKVRLTYKQSPTQTERRNSITVGQPFVGGGLTTRPLGNYIIDDRSLILDDDDDQDEQQRASVITGGNNLTHESERKKSQGPDVDPQEWYKRVENSRHILESVEFDENRRATASKFEDWSNEIDRVLEARKYINSFLDKSRLPLESTARLIDRQLQLIEGREKYLQAHLRQNLDDFLKVWRKYSLELEQNKDLLEQVESRTDKFESLDNKLESVHRSVEARKRELNDESKLGELRVMIDRLKEENKQYDEQIGLLLAVYFKLDS